MITTTSTPSRNSLASLSVEEQNLAAIPFAVLERRVGKRLGKIELKGTKILPDGREVQVEWQVQGNAELGLPTEQDLDIFVALGVLTFQNNFQKTVTFTGRQLAGMLNISGVHGKYYRRLKLAIDRFIPLRIRAITATEREEDIKWLNVFQEASFSLDRTTGVCSGSVTWTDKVIQSMNYGFFRFLDAGRYMELDGITAKHLYRYLAGAFEKKSVIVEDARELARNRLGIVNVPAYFSRLMQTLEPAMEQLIRAQVISSYHVVSQKEWTIGLVRHPAYTGESERVLSNSAATSLEVCRANAVKQLEKAGLGQKQAELYAEAAVKREEVFLLDRASRLLDALREEEVLPHVALSLIRKALDICFAGPQVDSQGEGREMLDWCEIAIQICRGKKASGQQMKNPAGFLVKLVKDPEARSRFVSKEREERAKQMFRQYEQAATRQQKEAEQQELIFEYEQFRMQLARDVLRDLPETRKRMLRKQKEDELRQQTRFERIARAQQEQEIDDQILFDLALSEAPPFERWYLRQKAQQAVLPFQAAVQPEILEMAAE